VNYFKSIVLKRRVYLILKRLLCILKAAVSIISIHIRTGTRNHMLSTTENRTLASWEQRLTVLRQPRSH